MIVLSLVNPKGGSGKTTTALVLALALAEAGQRVALLDLDPAGNLAAWVDEKSARGEAVPFAFARYESAEQNIVKLISGFVDSGEHDVLILDTEGAARDATTRAFSRTSHVLVPLSDSPQEARKAIVAIQTINEMEEVYNRPIPYRVVFTRTNAAIRTRDYKNLVRLMEAGDIPVLPVQLVARQPYKTIFTEGKTLRELEDEGLASATKAIENANRFAEAVVDFVLDQNRKAEAA